MDDATLEALTLAAFHRSFSDEIHQALVDEDFFKLISDPGQIAQRAMFEDPRFSAHRAGGADRPVVASGPAFNIGFALGLRIGARIASDPLAEIDVTDLIEATADEYSNELHEHQE